MPAFPGQEVQARRREPGIEQAIESRIESEIRYVVVCRGLADGVE